jgi:septum formation protein
MSGAKLVLASGSVSRRAMLEAAGVPFATAVPGIDEETVKTELLKGGMAPDALATALAEAKACDVGARHADALVLGADQVLVCEGRMFNKCLSEAEARETLCALRGREHVLYSAAVLARGAKPVWRHCASAKLAMRDFPEGFLDDYLTMELPDALGSVGVYRIEGRGAQLFERVDGDQFVIRGLPLFPVLDALRSEGVLQ